jgi:hypothetical protein
VVVSEGDSGVCLAELIAWAICFNARKLDDTQLGRGARLAEATPLWEWIGDDDVTVFSY